MTNPVIDEIHGVLLEAIEAGDSPFAGLDATFIEAMKYLRSLGTELPAGAARALSVVTAVYGIQMKLRQDLGAGFAIGNTDEDHALARLQLVAAIRKMVAHTEQLWSEH